MLTMSSKLLCAWEVWQSPRNGVFGGHCRNSPIDPLVLAVNVTDRPPYVSTRGGSKSPWEASRFTYLSHIQTSMFNINRTVIRNSLVKVDRDYEGTILGVKDSISSGCECC